MKRRKSYLNNRIARQSEAFKRIGLLQNIRIDWRTNIKPMIENGEIVGYYVIDETFILYKTIMI